MSQERREMSKVIVTVVFIGLAIAAVAKGVVPWLQAQAEHSRKMESTRATVKQTAALFDIDEQFAEKGLPNDAWGNQLVVKIDGGAVHTCTVASKGADGIYGTKDDIQAVNSNINVAESGKVVGHVTGEFGIGAMKGVKDAVVKEDITFDEAGEKVGEATGKFSKGAWKGLKKAFGGEDETQVKKDGD